MERTTPPLAPTDTQKHNAAAEAAKRNAAEAAVAEIADGMLVGLGTGSTAAFAITALGRRVAQGLRVTAVATSLETARLAEAAGIAVRDMAAIDRIDLDIDGVDEIDPGFAAIKGAGGAMLREKVIAAAATRVIAIADASKAVAQLGARPIPVEVLPLAQGYVARALRDLGAEPRLRTGHAGPWITDQGNVIIDAQFAAIADPAVLAARIAAIPGALGHGLFVTEIDALYLGTAEGVVHRQRGTNPG